jgi:hypothetical protein
MLTGPWRLADAQVTSKPLQQNLSAVAHLVLLLVLLQPCSPVLA